MNKQIFLSIGILFSIVVVKGQTSLLDSAFLSQKASLLEKGIDTLWKSSCNCAKDQYGKPFMNIPNRNEPSVKQDFIDVFWMSKGIVYTERLTEFAAWEKENWVETSEQREIPKSNFTKDLQTHIGEVEKIELLKPRYSFDKGNVTRDCDDCFYCSLSFYIKDKHFVKTIDELDVEEYTYENHHSPNDKRKYINLNYAINQKTLLKRLIDWQPK